VLVNNQWKVCKWIGWIGLDWIGLDWIGLDKLDWTGLEWTGLDLIGLYWIGLDWIGLDWIGLDWIGLDWIGLDWIGLDWIGLDWDKLDWIGWINWSTFIEGMQAPTLMSSPPRQLVNQVCLGLARTVCIYTLWFLCQKHRTYTV